MLRRPGYEDISGERPFIPSCRAQILPAGSAAARVEGTYVTVGGSRNLPPVTRGSYVTMPTRFKAS